LKKISITTTDNLPVALQPVKDTLRGLAFIKKVPLPFNFNSSKEKEFFINELIESDGILLRSGNLSRDLIEKLPNLQIIAVHGSGVDQVNLEACNTHNVIVTNTPGANSNSVAELTIGLMISLLRKIPEINNKVKIKKIWDQARVNGNELKGKKLGLIGFGQIGKKVAKIANSIGMDVSSYDPNINQNEMSKISTKKVDISLLLTESDIVSLHIPLTELSHHIISKNELKKMKIGSYIINTARGALIDELALSEQLINGNIAGAALDILEGEPPDPQSPIFKSPNVIITPHIGGSTYECLENIAKIASENLADFFKGEIPKHTI
tara:strand:- start:546 stop:1517 length:972 start_codon:yes stop_codon:yes gene_type:complete